MYANQWITPLIRCIKNVICQHFLQLKIQIAETRTAPQQQLPKTARTHISYNIYPSIYLFSVNWLDNKYNRGRGKKNKKKLIQKVRYHGWPFAVFPSCCSSAAVFIYRIIFHLQPRHLFQFQQHKCLNLCRLTECPVCLPLLLLQLSA